MILSEMKKILLPRLRDQDDKRRAPDDRLRHSRAGVFGARSLDGKNSGRRTNELRAGLLL